MWIQALLIPSVHETEECNDRCRRHSGNVAPVDQHPLGLTNREHGHYEVLWLLRTVEEWYSKSVYSGLLITEPPPIESFVLTPTPVLYYDCPLSHG